MYFSSTAKALVAGNIKAAELWQRAGEEMERVAAAKVTPWPKGNKSKKPSITVAKKLAKQAERAGS